jgi:hypothetical protein
MKYPYTNDIVYTDAQLAHGEKLYRRVFDHRFKRSSTIERAKRVLMTIPSHKEAIFSIAYDYEFCSPKEALRWHLHALEFYPTDCEFVHYAIRHAVLLWDFEIAATIAANASEHNRRFLLDAGAAYLMAGKPRLALEPLRQAAALKRPKCAMPLLAYAEQMVATGSTKASLSVIRALMHNRSPWHLVKGRDEEIESHSFEN